MSEHLPPHVQAVAAEVAKIGPTLDRVVPQVMGVIRPIVEQALGRGIEESGDA